MKQMACAIAGMFMLLVTAPVYADDAAMGDFCNPKKLEECTTKIDSLLQSLDTFRIKLLKTREEIKSGKKLTNQQADRLLKRMDEMERVIPSPTTSGFLYDN
jgi:hypothetical protein